jgi:hypothetical protein
MKVRKPRPIRGMFYGAAIFGGKPHPIEIHITHSALNLTDAKIVNRWLAQAIKYLEQKK